MASDHIVRAYDQELSRLTNTILRMGGLVEAQIAAAAAAITARDSAAAKKIVADDQAIDELEYEVERQVTKMLALRQPMAVDLRGVIGALRLASDLERMGDLAANIAKRAIAIATTADMPPLRGVPRLAQLVQDMVKQVLDAYIEGDVAKAVEVWERDAEVDEMYNSLFRELLTYMFEDPTKITASTHLLFVAKNLERISDHATNMAEVINFLHTGERDMGKRPKADTTSTFTGNGSH